MKFNLCATLLAAILVPVASAQTLQTPAAPDELQKTLLASANGLAQAYMQMDQGLFMSLIAPDFLYVSKWGVLDPEGLSNQVQSCVLSSFDIASPRAHLLSTDSAILIFKAHQSLSCGGKPEPSDLVVTEVFEQKGGKWLMSSHMQTAAQ